MGAEPLNDVSRVAAQNQLDLHRYAFFRFTRRFFSEEEETKEDSILSLSLSLPAANPNRALALGACRGTSSSRGAREEQGKGKGEGVLRAQKSWNGEAARRSAFLLPLCVFQNARDRRRK